MEFINGVEVRNELLKEYKDIIERENLSISLAIIQVDDDPASNTYIRNKIKYCEEVGIRTRLIRLGGMINQSVIESIIESLNVDPEVTGIILQSPLPIHLDFTSLARLIDPEKDVDGFTEKNLFGVRDNKENIVPCTVRGILKLIEHYQIDLENKSTVVIGRSNIVGRPLFDALVNRDATVTLCHSKTKNLALYTRNADLVISAVGKPNLITPDMVKDNFIGIDVGISVVDGKLVGDFSKDTYPKASLITPVPGGVGPMTVAMIIGNLIDMKRKTKENRKLKY